jgi:DNA ligase D-like protein (predicted 3'-phosphoesterase)
VGCRFVLQQHDATRLHFDLRLEVGGVFRSWAVPRGLSLNPADRRLAQPVEDHALSAGDFEGVHAGARRGSGAVIIWDRGTYRSLDVAAPVADALAVGHAALWLEGEKLRGGWALTRVAEEPRERWIVVKVRDEHADRDRDIVAERPASVVSGRTLAEVIAGAR